MSDVAPEKSVEVPKVVGLDGKPVHVAPETNPKVMKIYEQVGEMLRGEKYVGIAVVLVDENGAVWNNGVSTDYRHHELMSGIALCMRDQQDAYIRDRDGK